jgi:predicted dienelactone hydrolase
MQRTMHSILALLLVAMIFSACRPIQPLAGLQKPEAQGMRPDAPEYAKHGPYWVGYRPIVIGEGTEHPLQAGIWYPALNSAGTAEDVTYMIQTKIPVEGMAATEPIHGHALAGAEIDPSGAPYPLVIYSHGFAANAAWASAVLEHLASHGFVVVAPEHQEQFDFDWSEVPNASIDRPRDIKQTLDFVEQTAAPGGDLAGLIDMEKVAMVGHSYGGYTSLAMAGAQYDLAAFNARCAALATDDPKTFLCAPIVPHEAEMAARAGLDPIPAGLWPSFGDPRVKAIVSLAGDSYLFDKAGLSKITIPLLAIGGTADTGTPFDWGAEPAYTYASSPRKALVEFVGGEHFLLATCDAMSWWSATPFYQWVCFDPVWDKTRSIDLINHFATAFLLAELKGDAQAAAALAPENVSFPGLKYGSAGYDAAGAPQAAAYTPHFEPAPCSYPVTEGDKVECGYLTVPEDRSRPDSPVIRLHVVNFKSKSASPQPDPIFVVHGGPGADGGVINWLWTNDPTASAFRADRDNIYLEYRGSNFSEPAFYCPELEADTTRLAGMSFVGEVEWSAAAVQACAARIAATGHNLSAYNPLAAAADLADLRIALGYDTVNVYAVSYGTVLAMLWMQHYPAGLGSIVLDSVGPPDVNWIDAQLAVVNGAFDALFHACAADPTCRAAYPDLETAFYTVLARLRAAPVSVTVQDDGGASYDVTIDDLKFVSYAREGMFIGDGFTTIPAGISAAYQGDFTPVARAWLEYLAGRHGTTGPGSGADSKGVYYTMMCTHYGGFTDLEQASARYAAVGADPSVYDWAVTYILSDTLAACPEWNVQPPASGIWEHPIQSDRPVLMLVGTFDSDSAPMLSETYVDAFANGHYYELPSGHALLFTDCGLDMIKQFYANPTQSPDSSCIGDMKANWVLP